LELRLGLSDLIQRANDLDADAHGGNEKRFVLHVSIIFSVILGNKPTATVKILGLD
jgi:hypothetical protein